MDSKRPACKTVTGNLPFHMQQRSHEAKASHWLSSVCAYTRWQLESRDYLASRSLLAVMAVPVLHSNVMLRIFLFVSLWAGDSIRLRFRSGDDGASGDDCESSESGATARGGSQRSARDASDEGLAGGVSSALCASRQSCANLSLATFRASSAIMYRAVTS